jgi:hypothetical protein
MRSTGVPKFNVGDTVKFSALISRFVAYLPTGGADLEEIGLVIGVRETSQNVYYDVYFSTSQKIIGPVQAFELVPVSLEEDIQLT